MRQESFEMPISGWNGLHAPQYIVRSYSLRFEPTEAAVSALNHPPATGSNPQGLIYVLGETRYEFTHNPHRNILVFATEADYFEKFAEPAFAAMEEEVLRVQNADDVRHWFNAA